MNPRSWTAPHPQPLRAPDPFLHRRLLLTDAWLAEDGTWRPLHAAESAELWSILGYVRWFAPALLGRAADRGPGPEPDAWLASRPLVEAIDRELARRGEIEPGTALDLLRALGLAPWEAGMTPTHRAARDAGR